MYQFLYGYLKPRYGDNVTLLYSDTDSFILEIITKDIYQDLIDDKDTNPFDTSNFPEGHPARYERNKGVLGTFKNVPGAEIITEVCAIRSKMYAYEQTNTLTQEKIKENNKDIDKRTAEINSLLHSLDVNYKALGHKKLEAIRDYIIGEPEDNETKKSKGTKKCVVKKKLNLKLYK